MNTIQADWTSFKKTIPDEACKEQFEDMKKAFYAGAASTFVLLMNMDSQNEDVREMMLNGLYDEIAMYTEELKGRR